MENPTAAEGPRCDGRPCYGAAIFFGEDMREGRRDIATVVPLALLVGIITVMPPVAFVILASGDLRTLTLASTPISTFVEQLAGHQMSQVMSLAVFNTMIAISVIAGRQLYATGARRIMADADQ